MSVTDDCWEEELRSEYDKLYYINLMRILDLEYSEHRIYPKRTDIHNALIYTPLNKVKVVILGQDPYHGEGQAHGLSFSVLPAVSNIPPSLKNIYSELNMDIGCYIPNHGYLKKWADEGVLLINSTWTVRDNQPNSHIGIGWERYVEAIIRVLNARQQPIVYMLWGRAAFKWSAIIDNDRQEILTAPHPSPLSAYRGFFGCRHFSKANNYLIGQGLEPIDWQIENI